MPRVFSTAGVLRLEDEAFRAGTQVLADSLITTSPDIVIGVARGGVPLAKVLADLVCRPVAIVTASHNRNDAIRQQATGVVAVDVEAVMGLDRGLRVLLCDDIYGTGATLAAVMEKLDAAIVPRTLLTTTLCRNVGASGYPNRWLWDVRDWVVFPWEPPVAVGEIGLLTPPSVARRHS